MTTLIRAIIHELDPSIEVHVQNNPRKANNMIISEHFDVVLTDLKMPGVTGESIIMSLERIKDFKRNPPKIIMMSGGGPDVSDMLTRLRSHGINLFIEKPFNMYTIRKMLEMIQNK
jgi:DNA-binding response OmpR family regulator